MPESSDRPVLTWSDHVADGHRLFSEHGHLVVPVDGCRTGARPYPLDDANAQASPTHFSELTGLILSSAPRARCLLTGGRRSSRLRW